MVFSKLTLCILSVVMIIGTTLQFIGYFTPGWVVFVYKNHMSFDFFHENLRTNYTYEWGMWFYHVCSPIRFEKCQTKTYHDEYYNFIRDEKKSKNQKLKWKHGQMYERMVLEQMWIMVALVSSIVSCVLSGLGIKMTEKSRCFSFWTVAFTSVSESLVLPMIAVHIHQEIWMTKDPSHSYDHNFPYSLSLCGIGMLMRSAAAVLYTVNIFKVSSDNPFSFNLFRDTVNVVNVSTTKV